MRPKLEPECEAEAGGEPAGSQGRERAPPAAGPVTCKPAVFCPTPYTPYCNLVVAVFQEILNSPSLRGTFFVPTAKAWDSFFATVRQRQGNPEAPAMVARYGQVMLYHLAQSINVPIATPTPGASKFAL